MAKYEFGFVRVAANSNPTVKVETMIAQIDKMLEQGWEYKNHYEMINPPLIVLFFQREKEKALSDEAIFTS